VRICSRASRRSCPGDELAAHHLAQGFDLVGILREPRWTRSTVERVGEPAKVGRDADYRHLQHPRAGRTKGELDRVRRLIRELAERDQGDAFARERVADDRGIDADAELALALELGLAVLELRPRLLDVLLEALLEALGRARDHVLAEPDADHDPDREGEEHRRQRCGVVAGRVPHRTGERYPRVAPEIGRLEI
jgi:hypothetical protein